VRFDCYGIVPWPSFRTNAGEVFLPFHWEEEGQGAVPLTLDFDNFSSTFIGVRASNSGREVLSGCWRRQPHARRCSPPLLSSPVSGRERRGGDNAGASALALVHARIPVPLATGGGGRDLRIVKPDLQMGSRYPGIEEARDGGGELGKETYLFWNIERAGGGVHHGRAVCAAGVSSCAARSVCRGHFKCSAQAALAATLCEACVRPGVPARTHAPTHPPTHAHTHAVLQLPRCLLLFPPAPRRTLPHLLGKTVEAKPSPSCAKGLLTLTTFPCSASRCHKLSSSWGGGQCGVYVGAVWVCARTGGGREGGWGRLADSRQQTSSSPHSCPTLHPPHQVEHVSLSS